MEVGQRIGGCGANARKARRARAPVSTPANGSRLSREDPLGTNVQAATMMMRVVVRCNGELAGAALQRMLGSRELPLVPNCLPDFWL